MAARSSLSDCADATTRAQPKSAATLAIRRIDDALLVVEPSRPRAINALVVMMTSSRLG
jgi:hypothetical protein